MFRESRVKTKDSYKIQRLLKILLFLYVFFPFRVKILEGVQAYMLYGIELVLLGLFLSELYYNKLQRKVLYPLLFFIVTFLFLMALSLFLPLIRGTGDLTYFTRYFTTLKKIIVSFGIVYLCEDLRDFLKLFLAGTTIYVLCTVIMLIPAIHAIYADIVVIQDTSVLDYQYLHTARFYTRIGLQGFSGFGWSFRCTFSVAVCCCEYIMKKFGFSKWEMMFYGMINLLGTVFYGRTGTIIAIACIIFTACYQLCIQGKGHLILSLGAAALIVIFVFLYNIEHIQKSASLGWMFEGFINMAQSGKFSTNSSTYIMDRMFVKVPLDTFLFGDARYTAANGSYYMGTDLGVMRPLLFWGIGVQIIYYMMPLMLLIPIKRHLHDKHSIFFLGIMMIIMAGFELKGEIVFEFCTVLLGMYLALIRGSYSKRLRIKIKKNYKFGYDQKQSFM